MKITQRSGFEFRSGNPFGNDYRSTRGGYFQQGIGELVEGTFGRFDFWTFRHLDIWMIELFDF